MNIADLLTKGTTPDKIGPSSCWQEGPKFLYQDRSSWPVTVPVLSSDEKDQVTQFVSRSKSQDFSGHVFMLTSTKFDNVNVFDSMLERVSDLKKALRIVAIVRRACAVWLKLRKNNSVGSAGVNKLDDDLGPGGRDRNTCTIKTIIGVRKFEIVTGNESSDAWNVLISLEQNLESGKRQETFNDY